MTWIRSVVLGLVGIMAAGCATNTSFVSSWKSPTAQPMRLQGAKVAAVVMMRDLSARRQAEDRLANEITARGAQGIPMYALTPESAVEDEAKVRAALEKAGVQGIVVMHPTHTETREYVSAEPGYALYWDGYYAHGWGDAWGGDTVVNADTVVTVDTRIYSLRQNQLVWAGQSKTTNPGSVPTLVGELAAATADQLKSLGLIAK